jgi:hypothetical protein
MPGGDISLYVWSPDGPMTIHVPTDQIAVITRASGEKIEVKPKKKRVALPLTDEPSLIAGIQPETFLPVEVVEEAVGKLNELIAKGEAKGMDVSGYKSMVKRAQELIKNNSLFIGLDMVQVTIDELTVRLKGLADAPVAGKQ